MSSLKRVGAVLGALATTGGRLVAAAVENASDLIRADEQRRRTEELEQRVRFRTAELEAANTKLSAIAEQLESAQTVAQVGSWSLQLATGKVVWSNQLHRIMGTDPAAGAPAFLDQRRLYSEQTWLQLTAAVQRSLATGEGYTLRLDVVRMDGAERVAVARAEVVRDASGAIVQLIGTLQDVTEQESVKAKLVEVSSRMQLATSAANIGVWDWNARENKLVWDEKMHALYGLSKPKFVGDYSSWRSAVHPADRALCDASMDDAISGARDFDCSFRIVRPTGELRYLRSVGALYRDPANGQAIRMVGVSWDITEQRQAEIALTSSTAMQRAILTHAGFAIIATDALGTITQFNRAAELLLGYEAHELVHKASPMTFHLANEVDAKRRALEAEGWPMHTPFDVFVCKSLLGQADVGEWTYVRKDGSHVPVLLTSSTLRDDREDIFGHLCIAVDLTQQKQHEAELHELNELFAEQSTQADTANRSKTMFLANMSHEIRTPIGAIIGVTYLLAKSKLSDDQQSLLKTIQRSSQALLGMINDVLDLSKVEAGQLTLDMTPFVLSSVLDDVAVLMTGYAAGKELELVIDADPRLPEALVGDRTRVMQIVTNLVGNAIKFTDSGMVRLSVQLGQDDGTRAWLTFAVDDTGIGVDAELIETLFRPFTQGAGPSSTQRASGTGLGLAIVKELVTMMGGSVNVESTLNVGSCFRATIPFERGHASMLELAQVPLKLLVVDDSTAQCSALLSHALRAGWTASGASSGEEALAMLRDAAERRAPFDAVIIDWKMPGMNGLELLTALRAAPALELPQPSVVLTTIYDLAALRGQPGSHLAEALIGKPITPSLLYQAITKANAKRARMAGFSSVPSRAIHSSDRLQGARLLVVDDNDINRDIARRILEGEGAVVVTASHGKEAVERLLLGGVPFDAVLMDIQMPQLDGIEAARRIRAHAPLAKLPIIALTAGALATDRQRALDAQMNAFVSKPFDPDSLIECIRGQIQRVLPEGPARSDSVERTAPDTAWPVIDGIETEEVKLCFGADLAFFHEMLVRSQAVFTQLRVHLASASESNAAAPLSEQAHRLQGVAGNIGARALLDLARTLERELCLKQPRDLEAEINALCSELDRVDEAIRGALLSEVWPCAQQHEALATIDPQTWSQFLEQLRAQDLAALTAFPALSSQLSSRLAAREYERFRAAMHDLDFETALAIALELRLPAAEV